MCVCIYIYIHVCICGVSQRDSDESILETGKTPISHHKLYSRIFTSGDHLCPFTCSEINSNGEKKKEKKKKKVQTVCLLGNLTETCNRKGQVFV